MIETSSSLDGKSSATFGRFGKCCERSPGLRNNFGNSSKSGRKSSESRQKTPSSVCLSTAASRKVVLQPGKSSRDNVESLLFNGGLGVSRLFVLSPSLLLNPLKPQSSKAYRLQPIILIGIVTYAFALLWDNLCLNGSNKKNI